MMSFKLIAFVALLAVAAAEQSVERSADPVSASFSCEGRSGTHYVDSESECKSFFQCVPRENSIEAVRFNCPEDLVFDQRLLTCVHSTPEFSCADQSRYFDLAPVAPIAPVEPVVNSVSTPVPARDVDHSEVVENVSALPIPVVRESPPVAPVVHEPSPAVSSVRDSTPSVSAQQQQEQVPVKSQPTKSAQQQQEQVPVKSQPTKSAQQQQEQVPVKSQPTKSAQQQQEQVPVKSQPTKSAQQQQEQVPVKSQPTKSAQQQQEEQPSKGQVAKGGVKSPNRVYPVYRRFHY